MNHLLKIQFISRDLPSKGSGGTSVYRLSLLRYLKRIGCKIEYLLLHYRGEDNIAIKNNLHSFNNLFRVIRMPREIHEKYPIWSDISTNEEIKFLEQNVKRWKPDLIIADHPWLSGLFSKRIKNCITAVLTHDVQYKKITEFKKYGVNPYKRNKGYTQPHWNKKLERDLLSKADIILAIQQADYKAFQKMLPSNKVVNLPMAAEGFKINDSKQIKGRCLFAGGSAQHNTFGLTWFLTEVWPYVIKKTPSVTLHICGKVCDEMNKDAYKNDPSIIFKGEVENLHQEYNEAQICIVPLKVGSGLKIKLVEAMSYGKACVSTSIGIQGIKDVTNVGVLIADDKVSFAKAIFYLLCNNSLRKIFGTMNKLYIKTYLTPDSAYGPFMINVLSKTKKKFKINGIAL